jgi:hypothetical protein
LKKVNFENAKYQIASLVNGTIDVNDLSLKEILRAKKLIEEMIEKMSTSKLPKNKILHKPHPAVH